MDTANRICVISINSQPAQKLTKAEEHYMLKFMGLWKAASRFHYPGSCSGDKAVNVFSSTKLETGFDAHRNTLYKQSGQPYWIGVANKGGDNIWIFPGLLYDVTFTQNVCRSIPLKVVGVILQWFPLDEL